MTDETRPRCGLCRFWTGASDSFGECRRRAPIFPSSSPDIGFWPRVYSTAWCGEFEPRPSAPEIEEAQAPVYRCDHCKDGNIVPPDETSDFCCPGCGHSTLPF